MAGFEKSKFVELYRVNKYKCKLCDKIVNQPMASKCCSKFDLCKVLCPTQQPWEFRVLFCRQCIKEWIEIDSNENLCPNCLSTDFSTEFMGSVAQQVSKEQVYCDNRVKGCPEKPILCRLDNHLTQCKFSPISKVETKFSEQKLKSLFDSFDKIKTKFVEVLKELEDLKIQFQMITEYSAKN